MKTFISRIKLPNIKRWFPLKSALSDTGILRYERIFGEDFISVGGPTTTTEFLRRLDLKVNVIKIILNINIYLIKFQPGEKVLDVGCGIGGGPFMMSRKYRAVVHGIDLSSNVINIANERAKKAGLKGKNS